MNEKIKEKIISEIGTDISGKWIPSDRVEQLINLVADHCAKICGSRVGNSDYNTGRMHCASDIKEHFGVE